MFESGCILAFFVFAGALAFGVIWLRAFVISQIWGWYMIPLFGVAALPLIYAFGLSCFVGLFNMESLGLRADIEAQKTLTPYENYSAQVAPFLGFLLIWGLAALGTLWLPPDKPLDAPILQTSTNQVEQVVNE